MAKHDERGGIARTYGPLIDELPKSEGWSFIQLSGPYRRFNPHHQAAYPAFASRVEALVHRDVTAYFEEVEKAKEKEKEKE